MRWVLFTTLAVLSAAGSLWLSRWFLLRLPENYFSAPTEPGSAALLKSLTRNAAGLGLLVLGALMALPGVPGQGVLTMLVGVLLLDFPGKRALERRWLGHPRVLGLINRLRAQSQVPPLLPPA